MSAGQAGGGASYQYEDVLLGKPDDAGPTLAQLNNVPTELDEASMLEDINSIISSEMTPGMTSLKLESFAVCAQNNPPASAPQQFAAASPVAQVPAAKPHTVSVNPEKFTTGQASPSQHHAPPQLSSPSEQPGSLLRHVLEHDSDGHLLTSAKSAMFSAQLGPVTVFQDSTRTYYNLNAQTPPQQQQQQQQQQQPPHISQPHSAALQPTMSKTQGFVAQTTALPQALDWSYVGELQTVDPASLLKLLKSTDPVVLPAASNSPSVARPQPSAKDQARQQAMSARLARLRAPRRTRGVSEGTGLMSLEEQELVARAVSENRALKRALDETDATEASKEPTPARPSASLNNKWEEIRRFLEATPSSFPPTAAGASAAVGASSSGSRGASNKKFKSSDVPGK